MKSKTELEAKIKLLTYLIERECNCDKSKCAEHFHHMKSLKYEYETELDKLNHEKN